MEKMYWGAVAGQRESTINREPHWPFPTMKARVWETYSWKQLRCFSSLFPWHLPSSTYLYRKGKRSTIKATFDGYQACPFISSCTSILILNPNLPLYLLLITNLAKSLEEEKRAPTPGQSGTEQRVGELVGTLTLGGEQGWDAAIIQ